MKKLEIDYYLGLPKQIMTIYQYTDNINEVNGWYKEYSKSGQLTYCINHKPNIGTVGYKYNMGLLDNIGEVIEMFYLL